MFINAGGVVQKRLQQVDGKWYKVAYQCHYHPSESAHAIYELETCRQYKFRVVISYLGSAQTQVGYIRHVEQNGKKFPMIFFRKNSKKGNPLSFYVKTIVHSSKRMRGNDFIFQR